MQPNLCNGDMHGGSFFKTGLANLVPFRIVSQHHGIRGCWPHSARLINYWSTQTSHSEVIWECDSQVSLASSLLKQHPCGKQTQQTDPAAVTTLSAPGWGPFESCILQSIVEKFFSAERFPSQSCQLSLWPPPPHPLGAEDWTQDFLLVDQTLYHWARSPTTPFSGFCHSLP